MIVLAIDTAGTGCFAAVYDHASVSMSIAGAVIGKGHAEQLMTFIDEALLQTGKQLSDIDRIAVTVGPGSFTGIRVGVAAARGLALALGRPAVGISTLQVLAASARTAGRPVLAVMDGKRGDLYCQTFDVDGVATMEPAVLTLEQGREAFDGFTGIITGSGADLLSGGDAAKAADIFDIAMVAKLGALADLSDGKPKPLYLRGADAKPQTGYALARA